MNLGGAIGALLPLAVGVALSPVAIVGVTLMVASERGPQTAPAFVGGWVAGIGVVGAIVLLLADPANVSGGGSGMTASGWIVLLLGVLLLALAAAERRRRPEADEPGRLPSWLAEVELMPPLRAFSLAAVRAVAYPKNLILTVAGALTIAQAGLPTGRAAIALVVFTAVAAATIAGPVVAVLAMGERVDWLLTRARGRLVRERLMVTFAAELVLAFVLIGDGLATVTA